MAARPAGRWRRPQLLFAAVVLVAAAADAARAPVGHRRHHRIRASDAPPPRPTVGDEDAPAVDTVHVVFSNHLDMGFTNQDDAVIEQYFYEHWPRAISLHASDPSFVFTTHAYLLSLFFFDCPSQAPLALRCPTEEQKRALSAAIAQGAITWHAAPFNPQYEMFDEPLLEFAIHGIARRLDRRFDLPKKRVVSLRDVPGLTRAALPALARAGVRAISAGVNGFSAPPGFPKNTPFLWRDPQSGAEVLYFVHPGGYGGLKRGDGCVTHRKSRLALCTWWNGDNGGPPQNASEVAGVLDGVREEFPEAAVVKASTLEAYVSALWQEAQGWEDEEGGTAAASSSSSSSSWPGRRFFEVVEGEVGDTWIHGVGSDVTRVADYRAALRARRGYCRGSPLPPAGCSGADDSDDDASARAVDAFSRLIAKVPEHTWGVAFGPYFGDFTNYTNAWLHAGIGWRSEEDDDDDGDGGDSNEEAEPATPPPLTPDEELAPNYAAVVRSWRRQYVYLEAARRALMVPPSSASDGGPAAPNPQNHHPILEAWDADVAEREALTADEAFARAAASVLAAAGPLDAAPELPSDDEADADGRWRPIFVRRGRNDDDDCSPFPIRFVHWSLAFDRCTGGLASLRRRRWDAQGRELPPGVDWAGGGDDGGAKNNTTAPQRPPHFAELRYDVYGEEDYEPVWRDYAYVRPVWVGDFGKLNLTAGLDPARQRRRVGAVPRLAASFFRRDPPALGGGSRLRLVLRFDDELVREAGAPREAWLDVREGPAAASGGRAPPPLLITAVWRRKTPTRRPEALWLRFAPGSDASVDPSSWRLSKVGGGGGGSGGSGGSSNNSDAALFSVSPLDVVVNGSHAMHAVSDDGVAVWSATPAAAPSPRREVLRIGTLDAALVAAGCPLPFPAPRREGEAPDLEGEGVSFNLVNNVWGTNWPMWSPWRAREVNVAFRFVLTATREEHEEEEEEEERREEAGAAAAARPARIEEV